MRIEATPILPKTSLRALAYIATGSLPPVRVMPAFTALLSMPGLTLLCAAAGYLLGSAFA